MRALPLCLLFGLFACGNGSSSSSVVDSGVSPLGGPCSQSSDCGPEMLCGFPVAQACNAQGVCVAEQFLCQGDGAIVCGCGGVGPVELSCIWGSGYAPVPVVSATPGCQPDLDASLFD
jgi:hypothetical protein